eukprot:4862811-Heterocapsa_arctica.AAC.1
MLDAAPPPLLGICPPCAGCLYFCPPCPSASSVSDRCCLDACHVFARPVLDHEAEEPLVLVARANNDVPEVLVGQLPPVVFDREEALQFVPWHPTVLGEDLQVDVCPVVLVRIRSSDEVVEDHGS